MAVAVRSFSLLDLNIRVINSNLPALLTSSLVLLPCLSLLVILRVTVHVLAVRNDWRLERSLFRWVMSSHPEAFEKHGITTRTLERAPMARGAFYTSDWPGARALVQSSAESKVGPPTQEPDSRTKYIVLLLSNKWLSLGWHGYWQCWNSLIHLSSIFASTWVVLSSVRTRKYAQETGHRTGITQRKPFDINKCVWLGGRRRERRAVCIQLQSSVLTYCLILTTAV